VAALVGIALARSSVGRFVWIFDASLNVILLISVVLSVGTVGDFYAAFDFAIFVAGYGAKTVSSQPFACSLMPSF
jgi:hypothetical protein